MKVTTSKCKIVKKLNCDVKCTFLCYSIFINVENSRLNNETQITLHWNLVCYVTLNHDKNGAFGLAVSAYTYPSVLLIVVRPIRFRKASLQRIIAAFFHDFFLICIFLVNCIIPQIASLLSSHWSKLFCHMIIHFQNLVTIPPSLLDIAHPLWTHLFWKHYNLPLGRLVGPKVVIMWRSPPGTDWVETDQDHGPEVGASLVSPCPRT